jgi:hypothetical protein
MNKRMTLAATAFGIALLVCATASLKSGLALVQKSTAFLDVQTLVEPASYQALIARPVMVSVIKDGAVVKQTELQLNSRTTFLLPTGVYDVRLEGEGIQTLVKRAIHVNEGERTNIIGGPMQVGTGVKTIEYATGGLSQEDFATRLAKLEAAVADLQKARQAK